ncbi:BON domain-containing protein [uncultured Oxalicibacterium sp.]|uniref:BON domain-containing protein n=1 Tax=uncultured Oxalicibacterium sp. TaxID=1168540 RepID=UPI0025F9B006|nr:BON domain-containing protein [uncultured Oxalicibacterium sp.]
MKTLPHTSKLAIGAAMLAVLFAAGCERRAQEPATPPAQTDSTVGVTPAPQPPSEPATTPVPGATEAPVSPSGNATTPSEEHRSAGAVVDDAMITTKVKTALLADSDIKGLEINVDTSKGVVSLNGAVQNQAQVDRAAKLAGEVDGVKSVLNNLTIKK